MKPSKKDNTTYINKISGGKNELAMLSYAHTNEYASRKAFFCAKEVIQSYKKEEQLM
jgi:hypothetical protein